MTAQLVIDGAGSAWHCTDCHTTTVPPSVDWVGLIDQFKAHIISGDHLRAAGHSWAVGHLTAEGWTDDEQEVDQ